MAATKKQCIFAFSVLNRVFTIIQSPGFTNDYKFCIRVNKYHSRHSNLNFAPSCYFLIAPKRREKESTPGLIPKRNHT